MDAILDEAVFHDFGRDAFMPWDLVPTRRVSGSTNVQLRDQVRTCVPRQPGVYGMIDAIGRLIYVGKSKSLRHRLMSYFMPTNEDEKAGRIIQSAVEIVWETQPSEFAALLREQYLIRTRQPRFNVQGIPNRQKPVFLCLGKAPADLFYVHREPDARARAWEGPFFGSGRVHRCVEILNRHFLLRDCANTTKFFFSDQMQLFDLEHRPGCLRFETGTCLGPCIFGCNRAAYEKQVKQAQQFLSGGSESVQQHLMHLMIQASERLHFEQATKLREDLRVIQWLQRRLTDHAVARQELTCVYPVQGTDGKEIWYLIRRGVVEHAVAAPQSARHSRSVMKEVAVWFESENLIGTKHTRREETLAIVSGWFRKFPQERRRLKDVPSVVSARAK